MAFTHGKDADFEFQDSGSTYRLVSAYISSAGLSRSYDTAETTNLASAAKEYIAGLADGTASLSGMFDNTFAGYLEGIQGLIRGCYYYPEGKTTGKPRKAFNAILTSMNSEAAVDGVVSLEVEFQVTGAVTDGTAP
jgi:glutamine synthetase